MGAHTNTGPAEGLPAAAYLKVVHEEDRAEVATALQSAIEFCGIYDIEYRVRQSSGAFRWLQARGRVESDGAGRATYFHGAVIERTFAVIEELDRIAKAHDSTVARVALAWLQLQPGVTSTIIGARRIAQLEDNMKALEVALTAQELSHLDKLTKPTFGFPANMQPMFPAIHKGGTRVNGIHAEPSSFGILRGEKPY